MFSALLDSQNGGRLELAPVDAFETTRRYVPDTNVLETTHTTEGGSVRVLDALNTGVAGALPWTELARRVEGVAGRVPMRWVIAPGTGFNTVSPWADQTAHGVVLRVDDLTIGVRTSVDMVTEVSDQSVRGDFVATPGSHHLLGITASYGEPLHLSSAEEIDAGIDRTIGNWQRWSQQFQCPGEWGEEVRRSVLLLKLLLHGPSGAVAAAATTPLPESIHGGKNWDYRFAWIRDTAYILKALFRFGLREETQSAVGWLLDAICRHGPELHVLYKLEGELPTGVTKLDAPGWRGIGPVVSGNQAADQIQLSVFGDLLDTIRLYVDHGHVLDVSTARMLANIADQACDAWRRPDAGMWELEQVEHYTTSKLGCWQALTCAVHLAELEQIPGDPSRWRHEAGRIREWVEENCWSSNRNSYVWYPGSNDLDASILLHAGSGFDTGQRMSSTIDALQKELGAGPLLYRFSGAQQEENPFLACSFWAVSALHWVGRTQEARDLMNELVTLTNDVGVLAEMRDPSDGAFFGNLPQGLSHLALVGAALDLNQPRS